MENFCKNFRKKGSFYVCFCIVCKNRFKRYGAIGLMSLKILFDTYFCREFSRVVVSKYRKSCQFSKSDFSKMWGSKEKNSSSKIYIIQRFFLVQQFSESFWGYIGQNQRYRVSASGCINGQVLRNDDFLRFLTKISENLKKIFFRFFVISTKISSSKIYIIQRFFLKIFEKFRKNVKKKLLNEKTRAFFAVILSTFEVNFFKIEKIDFSFFPMSEESLNFKFHQFSGYFL